MDFQKTTGFLLALCPTPISAGKRNVNETFLLKQKDIECTLRFN